jgi:serine carboxypeptidase-like clade I
MQHRWFWYTSIVFAGPFSFDLKGHAHGLPKLLYNQNSWTRVSNVIFLDSPVGAGFSYSNTEQGYKSSDTKAVNHILIFLTKVTFPAVHFNYQKHSRLKLMFFLQWFDEHPEFLSNPLYIAGDSYSGKIVPPVTSQIAGGNLSLSLSLVSFFSFILFLVLRQTHLFRSQVCTLVVNHLST